MKYLLLNGDRQDAFWRLAVAASGLAVSELNAWQDCAHKLAGWRVSAVPCVIEVDDDDNAVFVATTLPDVQQFEAAKQAYLASQQ